MRTDDLHPGDHSHWTGSEIQDDDSARDDQQEREAEDQCPECGGEVDHFLPCSLWKPEDDKVATLDRAREAARTMPLADLASLASLDPRDPLFGVALGHLLCRDRREP